jgi:hypothetical protein
MVNNEEEPNIFMFGDKEDWKNFLLEAVLKLLS